MKYIVEELKYDSSRGHNFRIIFEERITLEQVVQQLVGILPKANSHQEHFVSKDGKYGYVRLQHGELFIKDERTDFEKLRGSNFHNDTYKVTENNMDFNGLEELYLFLQDRE